MPLEGLEKVSATAMQAAATVFIPSASARPKPTTDVMTIWPRPVAATALITIVGLVTFGASTCWIVHSDRLYEWLAPWLGAFERRTPFREGGAEARAGS